jgi:hypothetical protein|tara:strand:+ start:105 stop:308 length:204 start_codon:yes stop_codon:yes gene_type:complete
MIALVTISETLCGGSITLKVRVLLDADALALIASTQNSGFTACQKTPAQTRVPIPSASAAQTPRILR